MTKIVGMGAANVFRANDASTRAWTEHGALCDDGIVVRFQGINQDEQDDLDAQNFVRGLKAPAPPDPDYDAIVHASEDGRPGNSHDAARWITGCTLAALTILLMPAALGPFVLLAPPLALAAGYFAPSVVRSARELRAAPIRRSVRGIFECKITSARFVCSGFLAEQSFDLHSMASFAGDTRLWLQFDDGRIVRLPIRLESRDQAPVAARLNELLREAKSISEGYRGTVLRAS